MKLIKFLSIVLSLMIFLDSCKDDEVIENITIDESFPVNTNNYWIYEVFRTDTSGNIVTNTLSYDSVVVGETYSLENKNAYDFYKFNKTEFGNWGNEKDTTIYTKEGNIVYFLTESFVSQFKRGLDFDINITDLTNIDKWLNFIQDKTEWEIIQFPIAVKDVKLSGDDLPIKLDIDGIVKYHAKSRGVENVKINFVDYKCRRFDYTSTFDVAVLSGEEFLGTPTGAKLIDLITTINYSIYIAKDIGIVKQVNYPYKTEIKTNPKYTALLAFAGIRDSIDVDEGKISTLLNYKINK